MLNPVRRAARKVVRTQVDRVRRHPVLGELYEAVDGTAGDYTRDHGPMYAGAVAFYALLSIIPLAVLVASAAGFFMHQGGSQDELDLAVRDVMVQVRKVIPYIEARFEEDLKAIITNRGSLGLAGLAALLLSSSQVFRALEFAFARTFARLTYGDPTHKALAPRNFVKSKLWFGAFVTSLVVAFLVLRLAAGALQHLAVGMDGTLGRVLNDPLSDGSITGELFTALLVVLGFVVVLKVFTSHSVRTPFAFMGGLIFYGSWTAAHLVYDVYLARFTNMPAMYGNFATIMIIVLWIYFSSTLLIYCGHIVKYAQRRYDLGPRWPKDGRADATDPVPLSDDTVP